MGKVLLGLLLALTVTVASPSASLALINGGFETGTLAGWTSFPGGNVSVVGQTSVGGTVFSPAEGNYMLKIGSESAPTNFNIANTVYQGTNFGSQLKFSYNFWSYDYAPFDSPGLSVMVNGATMFTLSTTKATSDTSFYSSGWKDVIIDLSSIPGAGGTITVAMFAGDTNDMLYRTGAFVDKVSVTPIPAAFWLLGSGVAGLAALRRKFVN